MFHLSLRVAWHDSLWNGAVCLWPSGNAFCASLDSIRQEKEPDAEQRQKRHNRRSSRRYSPKNSRIGSPLLPPQMDEVPAVCRAGTIWA